MKKIEINTSHNIVIQYELAMVIERVLAFIIDLAIVLISSTIILLMYKIVAKYESDSFKTIIFVIPLFFYNLVSEIRFNGQSIGKKVMKIKVMKIDGEKPSSFDYITRWAFRVIEIMITLGTLVILNIASSKKNQRFGDFFSGMVVVKTKLDYLVDFKNIAGNYNQDSFKPIFPGVIAFTENEMMLIKTTLNRYQTHKNKAHNSAFELMIKKIEEQLNISAPRDKVGFVNQLIKDYVFLTR